MMSVISNRSRNYSEVTINHEKESQVITATGNGRLDAVSNAIKQYFNVSYELSFYEEPSLTKGSSSKAVAYVGIICQGKTFWGVGIDAVLSRHPLRHSQLQLISWKRLEIPIHVKTHV